MNTHNLFNQFNTTIKLTDSKKRKLKGNRDTLREKIKENYQEKSSDCPKFYSQGSFPLKTNLNPISETQADGSVKEKYDLDDGVYFICPQGERKETATYHDQVKKAVDGHTGNIVDKNTCVRVIYADGHHIDLPIYWSERDDSTPELAHKSDGFIQSDPKAFGDWVKNHISRTNEEGQLRRIIRYLKAWKNYRENANSSLRLPSGFILTILACENFVENDRDDLSLLETSDAINTKLATSFTCYRPTIPTDEELLQKYNKDTTKDAFKKLVEKAQNAVDAKSKKEASECWRKVFGDRFPLGKDEESGNNSTNRQSPIRTPVSAPWLSN